jgi:hypothetical protein
VAQIRECGCGAHCRQHVASRSITDLRVGQLLVERVELTAKTSA